MVETFKNVWDALIKDPAERELCKLKSELMILVEQYINNNNITQDQAAELMGVTQSNISNIVRGKMNQITIDKLVKMLTRVDISIEIEIGEKKSKFVLEEISPSASVPVNQTQYEGGSTAATAVGVVLNADIMSIPADDYLLDCQPEAAATATI